MPEYQPRAICEGLDPFTRAYLEAAEWSGVDEEDREAFEAAESPNWDLDTVRAAAAECAEFRHDAGGLLGGISDSSAGHDFWLTRCGHGVGFWSRDLGEVGEKLTKLCERYGEAYVTFDPESEKLEIS